jgi:hypothetical protein
MDWVISLFSHNHVAACSASFFAGLATDWLLHGVLALFAATGWIRAHRAKRHHAHKHGHCETAQQVSVVQDAVARR